MLYIFWKYILPKFSLGNKIKFDPIDIWVIIALIIINFFYRFSFLSLLISINMEQYFPLILGIIGVIIYILRCFNKEKDITYFGLITAYLIGPIIFEIYSSLIALGLPSGASLILTLSTIGHSIWEGLLFSTPAGAGGVAPSGAGLGGNIEYVTGFQPSGPLRYLVRPIRIHYVGGLSENGLIYAGSTRSPRDPGLVSNWPKDFTTPFYEWEVIRFRQAVSQAVPEEQIYIYFCNGYLIEYAGSRGHRTNFEITSYANSLVNQTANRTLLWKLYV